MNIWFEPDEIAFRDEVAEVLRPHREAKALFADADPERVAALHHALVERNWLAICWPKPFGGEDKPAAYEYILWNEMAYIRGGRPPLGAGIVARSIQRFGTEAQQRHWLPLIRRNEIRFCLGYSEPEAGSDLASLTTTAVRTGDHYLVNGGKIWTSYAEFSDFIWLLCRTGAPDSRGKGLSLLIVDRRSPGITLRNDRHMDGHRFSQIFLEDVAVPVANRVGPENGAWQMMAKALADERHVQFAGARVWRDFDDAVAWLDRMGLSGDAFVKHRLAELELGVMEAEALSFAVLADMAAGRNAAASAAANKIAHTDAIQSIARFVMDVGGASAVVVDGPDGPEAMWRQTMIESIGGGASEIMKGIIARQDLGLTL